MFETNSRYNRIQNEFEVVVKITAGLLLDIRDSFKMNNSSSSLSYSSQLCILICMYQQLDVVLCFLRNVVYFVLTPHQLLCFGLSLLLLFDDVLNRHSSNTHTLCVSLSLGNPPEKGKGKGRPALILYFFSIASPLSA